MGEGATDSAKTQKGNDLFSHIQRQEMIYACMPGFSTQQTDNKDTDVCCGLFGRVWMNMCVLEHMHLGDHPIFFIKISSFGGLEIQ